MARCYPLMLSALLPPAVLAWLCLCAAFLHLQLHSAWQAQHAAAALQPAAGVWAHAGALSGSEQPSQ